MKVKETLVFELMKSGYDIFTAGEIIDKLILEFRQSGKKEQTFYYDDKIFKLTRKQS